MHLQARAELRTKTARKTRDEFRIVGGSVSIFRVPLKVPFITAAGRKDAAMNAGIRIRLKGGQEGYGEASSSVVQARLKPERLAQALRAELRQVIGKDVRAFAGLSAVAWGRNGNLAPAAAAFECALLDALTRQRGVRMAEWFGGALDQLETDLTLSAASPWETAQASHRAVAEGFRILKVKVGTGHSRDLARVRAAWASLRGAFRACHIILDGNQGFSPAQALKLSEACLRVGAPVAMFEQPIPRGRLKALAALRRHSPVLVAADEDVRSPEDALRVLDADAADVLNVKVAKTGIVGSLQIAALARAAGKRLMIGCMQESAAGLSPAVHLALGTGAFEFVDLDSDHLLTTDQPRGDYRREGPWISLDRRPPPRSMT